MDAQRKSATPSTSLLWDPRLASLRAIHYVSFIITLQSYFYLWKKIFRKLNHTSATHVILYLNWQKYNYSTWVRYCSMFDYQLRGHCDIGPLRWSSVLKNSFTEVKLGHEAKRWRCGQILWSVFSICVWVEMNGNNKRPNACKCLKGKASISVGSADNTSTHECKPKGYSCGCPYLPTRNRCV